MIPVSTRCWAALRETLRTPLDNCSRTRIPCCAWPRAAWHAVETDALLAWLSRLGPDVEVGPTPTQAQADAWASEHTGALIDKFPVAVDDQTAVVLASAVACAISWRAHFHEAAASQTHASTCGRFRHRPERVAHTGSRGSAADRRLGQSGRLAVHAMPSTDDDMLVVSVIADPAVDSADVLARAHDIATSLAREESVAGQRALFDLANSAPLTRGR